MRGESSTSARAIKIKNKVARYDHRGKKCQARPVFSPRFLEAVWYLNCWKAPRVSIAGRTEVAAEMRKGGEVDTVRCEDMG